MRKLTTAALLSAAAALSGCAEIAGEEAMSPVFGHSVRAFQSLQGAHSGMDPRLVAISQEFQAQTDEVVTFAFDKATLDATARRALDGQAAWLLTRPWLRMAIVGHTDLVGNEAYNYGLGLRRARAVLEYLVSRGVDRNRLIAIESLGEQAPVVPTTGRERLNRRAVTIVAGYAGDGFGLDGVYAARIYDAYQAGEREVTEARSTVGAAQ